jgi:hypothetical protein
MPQQGPFVTIFPVCVTRIPSHKFKEYTMRKLTLWIAQSQSPGGSAAWGPLKVRGDEFLTSRF